MNRLAPPALALALALAACEREAPQPPLDAAAVLAQATRLQTPPKPELPPPVPASDLLIKSRDDSFRFTWRVPAEVAEEPALVRMMRASAQRMSARMRLAAASDAAGRPADAPALPHSYSAEYLPVFDGQRLLALLGEVSTFTGGAHPNQNFQAILWDRATDRRIAFAELFTDPLAALETLREPYCEALDAQRQERRGEQELEGEFAQCPPLARQQIVPVDDGDGALTGWRVVLPPYVAGPYAEGAYDIMLPVREETLALLRPEYRDALAPAAGEEG